MRYACAGLKQNHQVISMIIFYSDSHMDAWFSDMFCEYEESERLNITGNQTNGKQKINKCKTGAKPNPLQYFSLTNHFLNNLIKCKISGLF